MGKEPYWWSTLSVRVGISVEGSTENEFVNRVLRGHLEERGVYVFPVTVTTKLNISGPNYRGGNVTVHRATSEITKLLPNFDYVTTLYDFYGFKGRQQGETPDELCDRIAGMLQNPASFIPYIQMHEFEALLFSDPAVIGSFASSDVDQNQLEILVSDAVRQCGGPENVNDSPNTAPS